MKKFFILSIFIFQFGLLHAQNITGTWEGYFLTAGIHYSGRSYFFLEVKQAQRAIWGVYNKTFVYKENIIGCLCSVTGIVPKNEGAFFDLYKERIEEHHPRIALQTCDLVNKISFHYVLVDGLEYLVGKWYTANTALTMRDGSSGLFVLHHVSYQTTKNVDQYFPNLDKLLDRGTTTDTMVLKKTLLSPDAASTLTNEEKDLINVLRNKKDKE